MAIQHIVLMTHQSAHQGPYHHHGAHGGQFGPPSDQRACSAHGKNIKKDISAEASCDRPTPSTDSGPTHLQEDCPRPGKGGNEQAFPTKHNILEAFHHGDIILDGGAEGHNGSRGDSQRLHHKRKKKAQEGRPPVIAKP